MVLVIIGIVLFCLLIFVPHKNRSGIAGVSIVLSVFLIIVGLGFPALGYEEPELIVTECLFPVAFALNEEDIDVDCYLTIQVGVHNKYVCCIQDSNGKYKIEEYDQGIDIDFEDIGTPVLETYIIRPIRSKFFIAWGKEKYQNVIRVPREKTIFQLSEKD